MPHHHPFQESFWSPSSSLDVYPNFNIGFNVLHSKLKQSMAENKVIIEYIQKRIAVEKSHAENLSTILPVMNPFDQDIGGGLKRCFEVVFSESQESTQEHEIRATNLFTTALDPLSQFSTRYERIITQTKASVEAQLRQLEVACKTMELNKTTYQSKCKQLMVVQPQYVENESTRVKVGTMVFPTRDHVWVWLQDLKEQQLTTKETLSNYIQMKCQEEGILESLIQQDYIKQNEDGSYSKLVPIEENKGFFGRWASNVNKIDMIADMMESDKQYRDSVRQVETMRTQIEQMLFLHYEEMESLELERIQTIKQAFISVAASLSNTIPRSKETFDNMMLYQETLKPDKDVQFIVEQYRTGQFNPKPVLYENYFHGSATDQLFGVPLEETTKVQSSCVPQLISLGLSVIESGLARLYDEEKTVVWTASLPLDRVHAAREQVNCHSIERKTLEQFDILLLASLIRLYLMELPECLFTFELYEPCKLLYSTHCHQDKDCRLTSLSKLLATLPSPNYQTVMVLLGHFHTLVKELHSKDLSTMLAKTFGSILMRPQIESKVSVHERHSHRLIQDLIENYNDIFTQESSKAQEENSNRPAIIIPEKKSSIESSRTSSSSSKRSSVLNFMRASQSTPTSSISIKRNPSLIIPMPSSSTLFEDPDEIQSTESSLLHTPPSSYPPHTKSPIHDQLLMEELTSLDSFFEDDE